MQIRKLGYPGSNGGGFASVCSLTIGYLLVREHSCEVYDHLLATEEFEPLMITARHGLLAGELTGHHNGPFDRMLVAQAITDAMRVVTIDPQITAPGAVTVW